MKTASGILLGALFVFGQKAPVPAPIPETAGPVFRVTSTLVQLDAVVTDGKGRNIGDLTPGDFEVLIDGKPQTITRFSYVRVVPDGPVNEVKAAPRRKPDLPPVPVAPLRQEEVRRTIVLMVDDLGLSFESMASVRSSLKKFVENQMQPGDLVAVLRTAGGSGVLQQFTADKRILLALINSLHWDPRGRSAVSVIQPVVSNKLGGGFGGGELPSGDPGSLDVRYAVRNGNISMIGTIGAVAYVVDALREMPGRKSVVLFSDGLPLFMPAQGPGMYAGGAGGGGMPESNSDVIEALRKLIDRANRAGTVIYTMHAAGLQTLQPSAADQVAPTIGADPLEGSAMSAGSGARGMQEQLAFLTNVGVIGGRAWGFQASQQGMAYLADKTGGLAYENGNDLNYGLDRVLEDQKGYYLLGFHPPEGLLAEKNAALEFHNVKVKVNRSGLHVRSRTGFFGETDERSVPQPRSDMDKLRVAMLSPFHSYGVKLRLTALYAETAKGAAVRNLLHINSRDLTWLPGWDGTAAARVQLLAVAVGAGDVPIKTVARSYELKIEAGKREQALQEGVVYTLEVPVSKPGAYQIRAAVRDEMSGKVGSASQFIEIPDVKKARVALAGIILQDGADTPDRPAFAEITPARRQFKAGGEMEYLCAVQKKRDPADLDTRVRIFRDGQEVYSSAAKVVELQGTPAVFGLLKLKAMSPGDYYLQVLAAEPGAGKGAVADQWTDFTVVP